MNDNSDDAISEALELLKQEKMIEASLANGRGAWTVVYDSWRYEQGRFYGGRYACFARPDQREMISSHDAWDFRKEDGLPCLRKSYQNGEEIVTYHRNYFAPAFEPLIITQEFHGDDMDALLLSEEFRLLMNLWQDPQSGNFYMISDDGSKELVVRFINERVEIRTPILRHYQAARQLDLVLFTDSNVCTQRPVPEELLDNLCFEKIIDDDLGRISRIVKDTSDLSHRIGTDSCSYLVVKHILPPPPQEKCGIWPFEKKEEYPEFIIGEDEDGVPIKYTCNPDELDASHRFIPVFFKKDVLQRYYDDSDLYSVGAAYLQCAQKWGVEIDNNSVGFVSVFLWDIGRRIPSSHWQHWLSYNISPIYSMSRPNMLRTFYNIPVEDDGPEHLFKCKYSELQKVWEQSWGWRLHREPAKQDAGAIKRLRVPLNETEAEFKQQLLNLALVLVDLLNEKSIGRECPEAKNETGGGISKLERFLKHYSYPHVERDISVLRTVQSMRSRIAAHASGSSGQKYLDEQLDGKTTQEYFVLLLEKVVTMLNSLIAFAVEKAEQSKT